MKLIFLIRCFPVNDGIVDNWIYCEGIPFIATRLDKNHPHDLETLYFGGDESKESLQLRAARLIIYKLKKL